MSFVGVAGNNELILRDSGIGDSETEFEAVQGVGFLRESPLFSFLQLPCPGGMYSVVQIMVLCCCGETDAGFLNF
jgi:hypothetical protein